MKRYTLCVHVSEYKAYAEMLKERGFKEAGTRRFENEGVSVTISVRGKGELTL